MKHILIGNQKAPIIGQGAWNVGDDAGVATREIEALRLGVNCGMTLIDTAEMYGEGKSEVLVGEAIRPLDRRKLFLVSKVLPSNAVKDRVIECCEASLARLGTDYLDLYLLHWREGAPLKETVRRMEELKAMGKIRAWGVSNFDTTDMEDLFAVENGRNCAVNQVLYHIASRGTEYDLQPWCKAHGVPIMAYCPLAQAGLLSRRIFDRKALVEVARRQTERRGGTPPPVTPAQILLAFCIRDGNVIAIPKSGNPNHTRENALASEIVLCEEDMRILDKEFPAPTCKTPLDVE